MAQHLMLEDALSQMLRIRESHSSRELRVTIQKSNYGGLSAHQTTEVTAVAAGFDWQAGQVILVPAFPMTELTPDQVQDIQKSVRAGGSWHAYQNDRKLRERIAELERQVAELKSANPARAAD